MKYPRVEVLWKDANAGSGWQPPEEAKELMPEFVTSLGYLLLKNELRVIIVQSYQEENGDVDNPLCIPTENVISIDYETFTEQIT